MTGTDWKKDQPTEGQNKPNYDKQQGGQGQRDQSQQKPGQPGQSQQSGQQRHDNPSNRDMEKNPQKKAS